MKQQDMMKQQLETLYWEHAQYWLSEEEFDREIARIAEQYGVKFDTAMRVYTDEVWPEQSRPNSNSPQGHKGD